MINFYTSFKTGGHLYNIIIIIKLVISSKKGATTISAFIGCLLTFFCQ